MGRPARKKNAIERSALELFVEQGIDGTSIRDIATRAGVTEGALYRHHKSKNALVHALFIQHYRTFADMIEEAAQENLAFNEMIMAIIMHFFENFEADPYVFQFIMTVRHQLLEQIRQEYKNPVEILREVMRRAVDRKEIPPQDIELTTQLMMGMVLQIVIGHQFKAFERPLMEYADQVAERCILIAKMTN